MRIVLEADSSVLGFLIVIGSIPSHRDGRDFDCCREVVIECGSCTNLRRAVPLDIQVRRGLEPNIDIFREAINAAPTFEQRSAAFHFEMKAVPLQTPKAMHDPVVLLDDDGKEPFLRAKDFEQGFRTGQLMDELGHTLLQGPQESRRVRTG